MYYGAAGRGGRSPAPLRPRSFRRLDAPPQQRGELVVRDGPAEIEALRFIAGVVAQKRLLLHRLYAFGDDSEIEALAHGDDRLGDRLVVGVLRNVADEGAVHLERVDREALQGRKRGVADP